MNNYETNRKAAEIILEFMGELSRRYDRDTMRMLRSAENDMEQRWGMVNVAQWIITDREKTELALIRYAQKNRPVCMEVAEIRPKKRRRQHVLPEKPDKARPILMAVAAVLGMAILILILSAGQAIQDSEVLIARADRIMEVGN